MRSEGTGVLRSSLAKQMSRRIFFWPFYICDVVLGSAKKPHRISFPESCKGLVGQMRCAKKSSASSRTNLSALAHHNNVLETQLCRLQVTKLARGRRLKPFRFAQISSIFASSNGKPYFTSNVFANVIMAFKTFENMGHESTRPHRVLQHRL